MNTFLGIELGSTRIKSSVIDKNFQPISCGDYQWCATLKNGIWTYDIDQALLGVKESLKGIQLGDTVEAMGISAMMHGYLAFDKDWNLLVPFRSWQNRITSDASEQLTKLFCFHIPQRWSIAHLYQAVLNQEDHIHQIAHITTLAGYIHYRLTGVNIVGIGEASGIFPIDSKQFCYDAQMIKKFNQVTEKYHLPWKVEDVLPKVLPAGKEAGTLTEEGAKLLDNLLPIGVPFAPPEGDAGTGMVATNAVAPRSGNVSAGTSIFSMIVLEKPLEKVYEEIDIVTTPSGNSVAMVHCNNGTADSNAWVSVLKETAELFGAKPKVDDLYTKLYEKSLEGESDCGGVLVCNYTTGEAITDCDSGRPLVVRTPDAKFTLSNFFRATLYATMVTLKIGMDILEKENVRIDSLTGHGGLFKTPIVGQKYLSAACNAPVTCMATAGEGGPYGMALLASFVTNNTDNETLEDYLQHKVFNNVTASTVQPSAEDVQGFAKYTQRYRKLLQVEKAAIKNI